MKLEEKLTLLRKEKGLTQFDLAEAVMVSRQAVSKWETGRAIPTTENLKYLRKVYGVSGDYLLNEGEEEPAKEEAASERERTEDSIEQIFEIAQKITIRWKSIITVLLLAALLAGVFIGWKFSSKDDYIAIGDILGEEVDTPDGEFHVGW